MIEDISGKGRVYAFYCVISECILFISQSCELELLVSCQLSNNFKSSRRNPKQ
jgi:hypothetical protein